MPRRERPLPRWIDPQGPPSKEEREAKVAALDINGPRELQAHPGQSLILAAVPVDADGNAIHGLVAEWESSDVRVVFVRKDGRAVAGEPGVAFVVASAGNKKEKIRITVAGGVARSSDRVDVRRQKGALDKHSRERGQPLQIVKATWSGDRRHPRSGDYAPPDYDASLLRAALRQQQPTDPLPDDETGSLYRPENVVGAPAGKTKPGAPTPPAAVEGTETAGRANFTFSVPVASLPGRGLDVPLGLTYNSRVWNESTTFNGSKRLTYDVDRGWPAPGFRLGYGHIERQSGHGYTLVEGDGTRRSLVQVTWVSTQGYDSFETMDGTFIRYYGDLNYGTLYYADGIRMSYSSGGSSTHAYPYQVTDSNGNYVSVSYLNGQGPRISAVQDTMGRYTRFHYDAGNNLVAITAPGYAGGADRQVIRFYYADIPINQPGSFTGALVTAPTSARVISHILSPGSSTGYRFDYSQTYGVIREIKQLRAMSVSYMGLDQTGVVTGEGQVAATTRYDYDNAPAGLNGTPQYVHRCDDWAGRTQGANGDINQWPCYTFADNRETGESTVTAPDGTITYSRAVVSADATTNGLVTETQIKKGDTTYSKVRIEWETDSGGNNQRVKRLFTTDESGRTKAVVNSYHPTYNNISTISEHDFTSDPNAVGAELRRTEMTYETRPEWMNRRLLRLVTSVRVFAGGAAAPSSRTDYSYDADGVNLTRRDDAIMHEAASNPFAVPVTSCGWECFEMPDGRCRRVWVCETSNPYDPATDKRGNLTQVTRYADAATAVGAVVDTFSYDITGNLTSQTADCCTRKQFTYTKSFEYAYPTVEARGDAGQLTIRASYDFNTGLVRETVDENNQPTVIGYDPATLRHYRTNRPDGGYTQSYFEDSLSADPDPSRMHGYVAVTTAVRVGWATTSYTFMDGRGAPARTFHSYTPSKGYVTADAEYDLMGRPLRTSNPYYSGGSAAPVTPQGGAWTARAYDPLGRVVSVSLPDGNTVVTGYNGRAVTFTDPGGKQRRQLADALGRLKEVHEPEASGSLGPEAAPAQATTYDYDALNNLVKVTQVERQLSPAVTQTRYFKYDSLGRMTHERQVEQAAPHFAPDPLTGNSHWSRRVVYNSRGLAVDTYDARDVHTHVDYDGLNRVVQVGYSNEAATTTPNVHYTYDQARAGYFNNGRVTEVRTSVGGVTQTVQSYDYDLMGRVAAHRQTIEGRTYSMGYSYNYAGHLTGQTYPSGRAVSYEYDDAARLSSVRSGSSIYASGLSYAPQGALQAETLGNGASHSFSYDARLQMRQVKLSVGGSERQRFDYLYGQVNADTGAVDATRNNGQIARIDGFTDGVVQWQQRLSYDALSRLASAREVRGDNGQQAWRVDYTYDGVGNRYQAAGQSFGMPVLAGDIDRHTNRFSAGVTYDGAGNIAADNKFRGMQYRYDANGRTVWNAYADGSMAAAAIHDGSGQRVATSTGGLTRHFVYDAFGHVTSEYQTGGTWERDYIYRGGSLLAVVEASGAIRYVTPDHQRSTRVVTGDGGAIVGRHDYLPFGEELSDGHGTRTLSQGYGSAAAVRQSYASTQRDEHSGLNHTPWRKLETRAGRWTSPDPYNGSMVTSNPQSFNRYAYVGNDPVNLSDPSGLLSMPDWAWEQLWEQPGLAAEVIMGRRMFRADVQRACDKRLGQIFGGEGAVFATVKDPDTLAKTDGSPYSGRGRDRTRVPGERPQDGAAHLYANNRGLGDANAYAFTPPGFDPAREERGPYVAHADSIPELQNYHRFYYSPGSLTDYGHAGGLVVSFIHTGPTDRHGKPAPANPAMTNAAGSIAVGIIGAYGNEVDVGGSTEGYMVHVHMIFYQMTRGGQMNRSKKIDPRSVFCRDMGF